MIPQEFAERVVFRPFAPALVSDVYLAWRKNAALSPAAAMLVETVRGMSSGRHGRSAGSNGLLLSAVVPSDASGSGKK